MATLSSCPPTRRTWVTGACILECTRLILAAWLSVLAWPVTVQLVLAAAESLLVAAGAWDLEAVRLGRQVAAVLAALDAVADQGRPEVADQGVVAVVVVEEGRDGRVGGGCHVKLGAAGKWKRKSITIDCPRSYG